MNRRDFLTLTPAVAVAGSGVAWAAEDEWEQTFNKQYEMFRALDQIRFNSEPLDASFDHLAMNILMIKMYPRFFTGEKVVNQVLVPYTAGTTLIVRSRALMYSMPLEMMHDIKAKYPVGVTKNRIMEPAVLELGELWTKMEDDTGVTIRPYVPLAFMNSITSDSFQPQIGFKTRFAIEPARTT